MKKKIKKPAVIAVAAVIVIAAVVLSFKLGYNKEDISAMGKNIEISNKVTYGNISEVVSASGTVLLKEETDVYGEDDGYKISKILVEEGDEVKAGQSVVQYDISDAKTELENKIRDTKRNIKNAELALESLTTPKTQTEITKLKNAVTTAEKGVTEAQTTYDNYESKLASGQDSINSAQLEINSAQLEVTSAENEIEAAQRSVDIAKADLDTAQTTVDNNEQLFEVGGISQQEYDDSITALNKQKNTYSSAEDTLEKAKNTLEKNKNSLEKAKSSLDEAKRSYENLLTEQENAKLNITTAKNTLTEAEQSYAEALKNPLSDEATKIKYEQQQLTLDGYKDSLEDYQKDYDDLVEFAISPVDGTVANIAVDETSFIVDNTVMLTISNYNKLIVSANIEEYDAPLIALGQSVTMTSDGLENKIYKGKVTKVEASASSASTNSGSETVVPIEISVDNPDGVLKPGYNLDLEISVLDLQDILTVPVSAVAKDGKTEENYVYKIDGETISKTVVETGESDDASIEIVSGLSENDEIIISNTQELTDGMTVEDIKKIQAEKENDDSADSSEGAQNNDRGERNNQMLPSGGFGGNGPGGGGPMGR